MERLVKKINNAYYLIYTVTILATIIGYFFIQNRDSSIDIKSQLSIGITSFVIVYIFISIPASFTLFFRNTKKCLEIEDNFRKMEKYATGASLRLLAVGFGLVISVVAFWIVRTESMIFCAGITAIALLYCKPTISKINSDLKLDEPDDEVSE